MRNPSTCERKRVQNFYHITHSNIYFLHFHRWWSTTRLSCMPIISGFSITLFFIFQRVTIFVEVSLLMAITTLDVDFPRLASTSSISSIVPSLAPPHCWFLWEPTSITLYPSLLCHAIIDFLWISSLNIAPYMYVIVERSSST